MHRVSWAADLRRPLPGVAQDRAAGEIVRPPTAGGTITATNVGACPANAPLFCAVTVSFAVTSTTLIQLIITNATSSIRTLNGDVSTLVYDTFSGTGSATSARLVKRAVTVTSSPGPVGISLNFHYPVPVFNVRCSSVLDFQGIVILFQGLFDDNFSFSYSKINLAYSATVVGSTENAATGQRAIRAVDGILGGDNLHGRGDPVILYLSIYLLKIVDLARTQVMAGYLEFSGGQVINVPSLPNDGTPLSLYFPAIKTTSLVFRVTTVSSSTKNIGLSELGIFGLRNSPTAYGIGPVNWARYATAHAYAGKLQSGSKAIDGVSTVPTDSAIGDVYSQWNSTRGVGSNLRLVWSTPVNIASISLFASPDSRSSITGSTITLHTGSASNTVAVPALHTDGTPLIINFPSVRVSSLVFTVTAVGSGSTAVGLEELKAFSSLLPEP
ncbi:hypothetical protein RQP46_008230 [Phenoliferia psychrophenolica]